MPFVKAQRPSPRDSALAAEAGGGHRAHLGVLQLKGQDYDEQQAALSPGGGSVHAVADQGLSGAGGALPHLDKIQKSFGQHDVSNVQAHTGGAAAEASKQLGAEAYTKQDKVAFAGSPSLHTAAHEAAHVVQQRGGVNVSGGVGKAGDAYETNADAVADAVVAGRSAEGLLSQSGSGAASDAVQLKEGAKEGEAKEDKDAQASGKPPAVTMHPYTGAELKSAMANAKADDDNAAAKQEWVAYGIASHRYYAQEKLASKDFSGLESAHAFEAELENMFPEAAKGAMALPAIGTFEMWLAQMVGAYLAHAVPQDKLREDKHFNEGTEGDKSADLNKILLDSVGPLDTALKGFKDQGKMARRELKLRAELFKSFGARHRSIKGGNGKKKPAVPGKPTVTGCNNVAKDVLKEAFEAANEESDAGEIKIKHSHALRYGKPKKNPHLWQYWKYGIYQKRKAEENYAFYDSFKKNARDLGAWVDAGAGRPKPGDFFILTEKKGGRVLSHIGYFKFAEQILQPGHKGELWHTFDGGQNIQHKNAAYDGSLNNIQRVYNPDTSTYAPTKESLAQLRTPKAPEKGVSKRPKVARGVNQSETLKYVLGWVDVGKLISAAKSQTDD